jgi:hypothetical protein
MISRILPKIIILLAIMAALITLPSRAADSAKPQYYEVRIYHTKSTVQQQRVNDYWQNAAAPAYNRQGIQPIGVFTERTDSATNSIYVLIPCDSLEIFGAIPAKLAADTAYQQAAAEFLSAPKANPAYERIESSLLVAFAGMKQLEPPAKTATVFELRTYLSPGEERGLNKIHMFESGEITLMKDIGLAPIFYGRKLIGPHIPCLMYMTCGEDMVVHNQHWKAFGAAPVWKQLQADPQYKDNVSSIIKVMLKRTAASQI